MRAGTSALLFATSCWAASCSAGGGGPQAIQVRRSGFAVAADTKIAISGVHLAFLADEATSGPGGTDLNGDGDTIDSVVVAIDMATRVETNLAVAAKEIAWIGGHLYLVVDESLDGQDWTGDSDTSDEVLLHVGAAAPTRAPAFVDELSPVRAAPLIATGQRLVYSSARTSSQPEESNLFAITSSAPLSPVRVLTHDATGPLSPKLLGKDEGLIFLALDETLEGRDLDGDGDATDTRVLALLDGTLYGASVRSTSLAMPPLSPFRARKRAAHDWDVGFLVSEAAQGATNLNDPALFTTEWQPGQCIGAEDVDAVDSVLHFLEFAPWNANPTAAPPVNTGLVGCRKIAIANGYVATISPESGAADPSGAQGDCDLNADGDRLDYVVRWTRMESPVLPLAPPQNLHALRDVAGGTHGLAEVESSFAVEVSENQDNLDVNVDGLRTLDYLGTLRPSGEASADTPWDFTHGSDFLTMFGGSWIAEVPDRSRLLIAMEEASFGGPGTAGANLNAHDPRLPGEDADELDSVPQFPFLGSSPTRLDFPLVDKAVAAKKDGAGTVVAHGIAFYRVSELDDTRDWNSDGLRTGFVLFKTELSLGNSAAMGTLNGLSERPAIEINEEEPSPAGAAFLADERLQSVPGTDFDGDGDVTDYVISYFLF